MKILIAMHKAYPVSKLAGYLPIQVGAELSDQALIQDCVPDNTGKNISRLNTYYNELTALYWAKYNLQDEDIIGLVHYRRYFGNRASHDLNDVLTEETIRSTLKEVDVIVPKKRDYFIETQEQHYLNAHAELPYLTMKEVLAESYSEYSATFDMIARSTKAHLFNMSIMRQADFQLYTDFLFGVLEEVAQRVDMTQYSGQDQRSLGFLAERLMDVWILTNNKTIREFPLVTTEKTNWLDKGTQFLLRKFLPNMKKRTHF
ncbi:DUF4422 domain-containing protein [Weissella muntiaci]|uniref:DUF4422 domain-containing protein n=1 Tax=Weissella muntiaci TaxID=2508881 RepID=A0A6C2C3H5_9LACO|nr:DUF4422 domain-containing protein [Weissella muntiaci]TYC48096.1 DUF4422 domain-containing protein [Weissella muntiaci]